MSAEDDRTRETATVLSRIGTAIFPAVSLAPWMSSYNKRTQAFIVYTKTIADVAKESDLARSANKWKKERPDNVMGAAYAFGFFADRLAQNMHDYAPSINGERTKQGISMAKASNPGVAAMPDDIKKKTAWERMQFWKRDKSEQ